VRAKKGPPSSEVTDVSLLRPKKRARIQRTPRGEVLGAGRERSKLPEIRVSRRVQETFSAAPGEWNVGARAVEFTGVAVAVGVQLAERQVRRLDGHPFECVDSFHRLRHPPQLDLSSFSVPVPSCRTVHPVKKTSDQGTG